MRDDALIHLRLPAAIKARWVRASRAAGMRLTDWITRAVEASMLTAITIPDDVDFADLHLARDPRTGDLEFDWAPIECICRASGLDIALFRDAPEDNLATLLTHWYREHRARGGARDPVQEDILAEVRLEDEHGGGLSHQPGRA